MFDLGGYDFSISGAQETRFRAREFVLKCVAERGWKIGWMADALVLKDQWDELGGDPGPWKRIASVEHRVTPTSNVLALIQRDGIARQFEFGRINDCIFVKSQDAAKVAALLRLTPFPGVVVHESP
jgi:hypothetical protein